MNMLSRRRMLGSAARLAASLPVLLGGGFSAGAQAQGGVRHDMRHDVRDYGARGDGKTVDSGAINAAIEAAAAAGGGTVHVPPGTYLSASIRLRSHVTLHLEAGAVIEAVDWNIARYDSPEPNDAGGHYQDFGHSHWKNSLIWGIGLDSVAITGSGYIHGKGLNPGYRTLPDGSKRYDADAGPGEANKAIALRECNNVLLRDFGILMGGHFGILATGCSNLTLDNLRIDTNRDGMDIDCCSNVRISKCSVNSPWDDGICLKASYALGKVAACENITISDCYVAGNFDVGTLLDGTFKRSAPAYHSGRFGRIKLGTESNGDFRNITVTNCVFDDCRGLAIESVDGSHIEDLTISNITMRKVANDPIFIYLGARLRGPDAPPVGTIKRVNISNIVVSGAQAGFTSTISGLPGHPVEDIHLSNLRLHVEGGGAAGLRDVVPLEKANAYPEPGMFGPCPAYGLYVRHAAGIDVDHVTLSYAQPEARAAFVLEDVRDAGFSAVNAQPGSGDATLFDLRSVTDFAVRDTRRVKDQVISDAGKRKRI